MGGAVAVPGRRLLSGRGLLCGGGLLHGPRLACSLLRLCLLRRCLLRRWLVRRCLLTGAALGDAASGRKLARVPSFGGWPDGLALCLLRLRRSGRGHRAGD